MYNLRGRPLLTSSVRVRSFPFQKATSMSSMSWGSSKENVISQRPPSSTILVAQLHLDSISSKTPSRVRIGWQPPSPSTPQPTSSVLRPARQSWAVAPTETAVLSPTSTSTMSEEEEESSAPGGGGVGGAKAYSVMF